MKTVDNKHIEERQQAKITDLLKVKPAVYQVCKWEIDPITQKPVKRCWIEEPKMTLAL